VSAGKAFYIFFTLIIWGIVSYYLNLWKIADAYWVNACIAFVLIISLFYSRRGI
jgi:Flp pilus assembly protein TadB